MSISLNLDDEQSARLEERARELGVDARELAKAAVNDLLTRPADDFDRAAKFAGTYSSRSAFGFISRSVAHSKAGCQHAHVRYDPAGTPSI